jgi:ABC-type branched-subunit amino acid transport system substrate-binding protein
VLGADPYSGGQRFLQALRERFGNRVTVLGSWVWSYAQQALDQAGSAARGVYAPGLDMPYSAFPNLTPAARAVARDFGGADAPYGVLEAAQAAELVLDAIARSDGTRSSVLKEIKASKVEDGILGDFGFDENGDITVAQIPMVRVTGRRSDNELPGDFAGAEIVSVIDVPPDLAN